MTMERFVGTTGAAPETGDSIIVTIPSTVGESLEVELKVDDKALLTANDDPAGTRDDAAQTKTLRLYAVTPDPNFPDLDGDGLPDNLPTPDEREEGTEHGDEDDGTAGTTGSAELAVSFEGLARACAGGLGDAVHAFTIQGTAKNADGVAIPSAALTLLFENNRGEDKRAQFVPDIYHNQALVPDTDSEEMTVATDENGHFDLTVRSSDTISNNIKVKVTWKNANGETENVGEQVCDFARVLNYRRFGIVGEEGDGGWKFDDALLFEGRGNVSPAKFWIKIQKNPDITIDNDFFDDNAQTPQPPDDWENWLGVSGHRLLVRIDQIVLLDGTSVAPERFGDYITLLTEQGGVPTAEVETDSRSDGSNQVWLKSGERITNCKFVGLIAYELLQFEG